ncbi:hypothetical protein F5883DRAFT_650998 [Diaporthe sp. PMI_573]|nr:hypothetical protein F5883DRAFT_650998 [Diaporthaceae sp. PMI_573]
MGEDPPITPTQATRQPQETVGEHTRPPGPPTPNNLPRAKRTKTTDVQAPPRVALPRKERADDNTAVRSLAPQLDELVRRATLQKDVLEALAGAMDNFVSSWAGEHQKEHRREARALVTAMLGHLNTHVFAASGGQVYTPVRVASNSSPVEGPSGQPRAQPASRSVSWADIAATTPPPTSSGGTRVSTRSGAPSGNKTSVTSATPKPPKEDLRVLIALDTDEGRGSAPRREPFEAHANWDTPFGLPPQQSGTGSSARSLFRSSNPFLGRLGSAGLKNGSIMQVPEVPWTFRGLLAPGEIVNTADHIVEEVEAQTGKLPAHFLRLSITKQAARGTATRADACEHHAANTAGKKLKAIRRAGGRRYDEANKPQETTPTDEMEITVATTAPPATVTRKRAHSATSTNTGSSPSHTPSETGAPTASAPLPQRTGERPGRRQAASQGTYNEQQLFNETRYGLLNDNAPAPNSHA